MPDCPWHTAVVPVIAPAAPGRRLTVIGKLADTVPLPHVLTPVTVRLPGVAPAEKLPVMEAVLPDGVKPVPE